MSKAVRLVGLATALAACTAPPRAPASGGSPTPPITAPAPAPAAPVPSSPLVADGGGSPAADSGSPPGTNVTPPVPESENWVPCAFGCTTVEPVLNRTLTQAHPPPALSGGTLLATRDGKWLVAADPDRDQIYVIDVAARALSFVRQLEAGDEPGRVIEDAQGRIHVALRAGGALATIALNEPDAPLTRRAVCDVPRGLAYDATQDVVHVACAEGKLVTLSAAPSDTTVRRTLELGRDLRDVVVHGDHLFVTRFRSAEVLTLEASGAQLASVRPPSLEVKTLDPTNGMPGPSTSSSPTQLWRALDVPGKGLALLHERALDGEVKTVAGGYTSSSCGGIVQTSITTGIGGARIATADLSDASLAIDMAVDASGALLAVVMPGNWGAFQSQLQVYSLTGTSPLNPLAPAQPLLMTPSNAFMVGTQPCLGASTRFPSPDGQAISVAFVDRSTLAMFEREPAAVSLLDVRNGHTLVRIDLAQPERFDLGHATFHMRTASNLTCASCHGEAGDDSHVWLFAGIGPRRTQSLRGGILGTEPFHWDGDIADFDALVSEVFVKRMTGPELSVDQSHALSHWIDALPAPHATPHDAAAVQRGQQLFQTTELGCSSCHSGPHLTNNSMQAVGTGAPLQVPRLTAVSFRLPLIHDGCAKTLRDRFAMPCGGGDMHGHTSQLTSAQLDDLVAYLETL